MHHTIIQNETPSSNDLVAYLDKESKLDREESLAKKFTDYLDKESVLSGEDMNFFNTLEDDVDKYTVASSIDKNCRKLSRDEARFYSITLDPSAKEINHIKEVAGLTADTLLEGGAQGTKDYIQDKICREIFKEYARQCMDEYARNFNRENVKGGEDLVWFGRVEKNRYWKSKSPEVQHNRAIFREIKKLERKQPTPERDEFIAQLEQNLIREKDVREGGKDLPIVEMMPKSGDNYHIHVIVSRRDVRQQYKLSPLATAKNNKEHIVGNKTCTIGFNRDRFANRIEGIFDAKTGYERLNMERYEVLKEAKKEREKEGKELSTEEIEQSVSKGWKDYFYLPKEQKLDGDRLSMPEHKPFDLSQKNNHDVQCKYIESSLRETLPCCNSMQELKEHLQKKGIVSTVDKSIDNKKDICFCIEGCDREKHTFYLGDISPNLSYYGIENYVKREWRKSFFVPKVKDKEAVPISEPTRFNASQGKDKDRQSEYIEKTLRDVMPYCNSSKELQDRLKERDINCIITYVKGEGKTVSFRITSLWNGKTFGSEEISPNLNYRELSNYLKEEYSGQRQKDYFIYEDKYKAQVAARYAVNRLACEAGLKYINKEIKPYRNTVMLGVSGMKILIADKTAKEKATLVAKRLANHLGYKMGFSVAPEFMGAISIVGGIKSFTRILGRDSGEER